ncbi:MAG: hypothetical protein IH576_00510 [Deltaproteobacteria bacterium]|nr:hypothetical protein [Deltaproteobacteria bacterium]
MSPETTDNSSKERWRKPAILVSLAVAALLIRAPGLGKWCFTVDEYYFRNGVDFILEKGIPQFPAGGYYVRGMLVQYLAALSSLVFPEPELASRIVPLLLGAASVPLFFLICGLFLPALPAFLCTFVLLLSSWHIEFSRFARMYAPFQFAFFSFIYLFYSGYFLNNKPHRTGCWIVAFLSVFIHEGSIVFPLLLLLPLITDAPPFSGKKMKYLAAIIVLLGWNYVAHGVDYHGMGVEDRYPAASRPIAETGAASEGKAAPAAEEPEIDLPVRLPGTELLESSLGSVPLAAGYLVCVLCGILFVVKSMPGMNFRELFPVLLAAFLPLVHQYGLLLILLVPLFLARGSDFDRFRPALRRWVPYFSLTILYWILAGIVLRKRLYPKGDRYDKAIELFIDLFDYPEFLESFLAPFWKAMPVLTIWLVAALFATTYSRLAGKERAPAGFVPTVLYLCLLLVSTLKTQYTEARYSFFFFPLFFIPLFSLAVSLKHSLAVRFGGGLLPKTVLLVPLILFAGTEDFHFRHVADVSSADLNFRTGMYERYSNLWYPRVDLKTPSEYVNAAFKPGDVVVAGAVGSAYYLEKPFTNYIDSRSSRFPIMSRKRGTEEIWTGRPLIYDPEGLRSLVPGSPGDSLWLIAGIEYCMPDSFGRSRDLYEITIEHGIYPVLKYEGQDGRIGVWELKRLSERDRGVRLGPPGPLAFRVAGRQP